MGGKLLFMGELKRTPLITQVYTDKGYWWGDGVLQHLPPLADAHAPYS